MSTKKMLDQMLDDSGNSVDFSAALVVNKTTGQSVADFMNLAGRANGAAMLNESGHLPVSVFDSTTMPVETTVADITARDALTSLADGAKVFVEDATADTTVTAGWAIYRYHNAVGTVGEEGHLPAGWTKLSESESLDIVHDWLNIQNRPEAVDALSLDEKGDLVVNGKSLNGETGLAFVTSVDDTPSFTGKLRLVLTDYTPPTA